MGHKRVVYPNLMAELARGGITITKLSKKLNISRTAMYRKIQGETAFTLKDITETRDYINAEVGGAFTLEYLFEREG